MTFEAAAASVISALGESVTYESDEFGTVEIKGVLSSGHQRVEGGRGPAINSRSTELAVLRADLPGEPQAEDRTKARTGDRVTVRGNTYDVAQVRPDEEGTQYILRLKIRA